METIKNVMSLGDEPEDEAPIDKLPEKLPDTRAAFARRNHKRCSGENIIAKEARKDAADGV